MEKERYVAYVGTYTRGTSVGIHIYDVDTRNWSLKERKVIPINNPSDVIVSNSGKYLYSISDRGVESFKILEDGDLEPMNAAYTGGLRGCYLELDPDDRFLFVAGYYDGHVAVLRLNEDGTVGEITDSIFHKGIGLNITDRRSMPHVTCVKMTPDYQGLCAVDCGLDQVKVYDVDFNTGKLRLNDIVRCALDSSPRNIRIDKNRKNIYVLGEMSNRICVYHADRGEDGKDEFTCIQKISTIEPGEHLQAAAAGMGFSPDGKHLFVSNAGINSVIIYNVDEETGLLEKLAHIKCSGDHPKALAVMPDNHHFVVLSHNTNEVFTYNMNYEEKYYLLSAKPVVVPQPNCIYIHKLS